MDIFRAGAAIHGWKWHTKKQIYPQKMVKIDEFPLENNKFR